jgi:hypothetical protein
MTNDFPTSSDNEVDHLDQLNTFMIISLLILTSSVIVDSLLHRDLFRDRIHIQVTFWLAITIQQLRAASTYKMTTTTDVMMHTIFASSIVSITYAYFLQRWPKLMDSPDYSKLLAPSLTLTLYYELFAPYKILGHNQWAIALLFFLSLSAWKWFSIQNHQNIFIPVTARTGYQNKPQESQWKNWTRSQVLLWISDLETEWGSTVYYQLAPQRITGCVLNCLTLQDLRSMGVSYGDAHRLIHHIHLLVSKYRDSSQFASDQSDYVDKFLDEIYHKQPIRSYAHEMDNLNEEAVERTSDVMKDRLGLELPTIRRMSINKVAEESCLVDHCHSPEDIGNFSTNIPDTTFSGKENHTIRSPFPDILDELPEHIQEIAKSKPDVFQAFWRSYQMKRKPSGEFLPLMGGNESSVGTLCSDDEETTSLLRKRNRIQKDP